MVGAPASLPSSLIPGIVPVSALPSGISGKLAVPVAPRSAVYAHFRHVVGVPSRDSPGGVPLLKLRILDNLIDGSLQARGPEIFGSGERGGWLRVDARTVDTYIAALAADLRAALSAGTRRAQGTAILLDLKI